jgi:hypothetical protein
MAGEVKIATWTAQVAADHIVCPHTLAMILGVRASAPRRRRERQASMRARARPSLGSLRAKTAVRLVWYFESSNMPGVIF